MRIIRYVAWAMVALLGTFAIYLFFSDEKNLPPDDQISLENLGGQFNLVRHDGTSISDRDLLGKPHAVFFGFTNCPEVCPTTLYEMSDWLDKLGEDANKIGIYFVTVDPARDTPTLLSEYLTSFDPRITGITGEKSAVEETLLSFKIYFKRVDGESGEYSMDHTAIIFLLDAQGKFVGSIAYGEDGQSAVEKLRRLLK